jgi:hypothetical protein
MLTFYNFYKGCINTNNVGDDILFYILLKMFKKVLINEFNIKDINISVKDLKLDINNKCIEIIDIIKINNLKNNIFTIGGGSTIHPGECVYSRFPINTNNDYLFLWGTGISNYNIPVFNEYNIDYFMDNKQFDNYLFDNKIITENFKIISHYKNNNNLYGGFRGYLEEKISKNTYNNEINMINDSGLFSDLLLEDYDINIKINSYDRKIIFLSSICSLSTESLKDIDMDYESYNSNIENTLIQLSINLINRGYFIYLCFLGNDHENIYYNKIISQLSKENHKYVDYYSLKKKDNLQIINIIKQSYIVIGARLHSKIIANGLLIPSINICYSIKCLNYTLSNDMFDYSIPTFKKYMNIENVLNKFNLLEQNYNDVVNILKHNKEKYFEIYYNEIKKLLYNYIDQKYSKCEIIYKIGIPHKDIDAIIEFNLS